MQLEVDYGELVRRISGRRTCADCGRVFNLLTSPPAGANALCPKTGQPHRLIQRPDDNEATVAERLRVYDEKTRPLMDFYRARGLLRVIDAEGDVDAVTRRLAQRARRAGAAQRAAQEARARQAARCARRPPRQRHAQECAQERAQPRPAANAPPPKAKAVPTHGARRPPGAAAPPGGRKRR